MTTTAEELKKLLAETTPWPWEGYDDAPIDGVCQSCEDPEYICTDFHNEQDRHLVALAPELAAEVIAALQNNGRRTQLIERGDRIAQLEIVPILEAQMIEVETLPTTARGAGRFGSTGK